MKIRPWKYLLFTFLLLHFAAISHAQDTSKAMELIRQAIAFETNSDFDSTLVAANEALQLSEKIGYDKGIAAAYMRLGSVMNRRGKNDSALAYIRQAFHIRKRLNDFRGATKSCFILSDIYVQTGLIDSAFSILYEALRFNKHTRDSSDLAGIFIGLGNLDVDYKDLRGALAHFLKGEQIAKNIANDELLLNAYLGLGKYHFSSKDFGLALDYYFRAGVVNARLKNKVAAAKNYNNIALCYDHLKKYSNAGFYYRLALQAYEELGLQDDEANTCYNIASMFSSRNMPDSAIYYLNKSLSIAREINDRKYIADGYDYLSDAYAMKGNFQRAYEYHVAFTALSDSLLNEEKISSISEMQTKYETEKKEQQITLLDEQNRTKAAQRNFFIAGSTVLLLGLFVLGFYYMQRGRMAKKNAQIAAQKISTLLNEQELKTFNAMIEGQEEERKRIASDLHDRLGSMLSTIKLLFSGIDSKIDRVQEDQDKQYKAATSLLDDAVAEVRRISHNMSTGMVVSFGLVAALEELCESIDSSGLIQCKLLVYGMKGRIDQQTEIGIYRIVQELFSNILKHAKAKQVTVQVNMTEESLNITVEDDGVGFDPAEKKKSGGMGLQNLEARAAKLNGVYHVDSTPGKGTISIIEIPLTQAEA